MFECSVIRFEARPVSKIRLDLHWQSKLKEAVMILDCLLHSVEYLWFKHPYRSNQMKSNPCKIVLLRKHLLGELFVLSICLRRRENNPLPRSTMCAFIFCAETLKVSSEYHFNRIKLMTQRQCFVLYQQYGMYQDCFFLRA